MKFHLKAIVLGMIAVFLLSAAFLSWYQNQYAMEVIEDRYINDTQLPTRILITTQGSEFKNELSDQLVNELSHMAVHVKVTDVTRLPEIDYDDWNIIVIIHTWEYLLPEKNVQDFVSRLATTDKLVIVTTSGLGKEGLEGVDGISSASILTETESVRKTIMNRINNRLKP